MSSDSSSDIDLNILDKRGNNINIPPFKKETSESDLYLNLLANPSKSRENSERSSSSINLDDRKSQNDDTSSVRESYKQSIRKNDHRSERRSDHRSDRRSERHPDNDSESSRARYEDVRLSEKQDSDTRSVTPEPKLTGQQLRMKKIDLLRKLSDLKTKGYKLTKEYDFNSSIEEMEYEYDLLKSFADRRNGIKLYKNTIINFTNLVEFFNDKYDPFGAELGGWSEHMSVEVDTYDDVLEELYEKYKGAGKSLPPEVKLLILIGFSASAFHFTKKHMSNLPGSSGGSSAGSPLGGIQSGIAQKIAGMGKETSKFKSEQELHIERMREEMREKDRQMKEMMRNNIKTPGSVSHGGVMPGSAMPGSVSQGPVSGPATNLTNNRGAPVSFAQNMANNLSNSTSLGGMGNPSQLIQSKDPRPMINTPDTVKDVLNRLHNREKDLDTIDTQDETTTNNDRLLSDMSASESKKKGKKKPLMKIE
jgi:hypothetical protein